MLDSNLRFFNGIWIALGVAIWCIVPRIEHHTLVYRLILGAIFLRGVGRLLSIGLSGPPLQSFIGFTILEIVAPPLLIWRQNQVAKNHGTTFSTV